MKKMRIARISMALAVALSVLVTGPDSLAGKSPRSERGSYDVTVYPAGVAGWPQYCSQVTEGAFKQSHRLVPPFSGWLDVSLVMQGDWDLFLVDAEGALLAAGGEQFTGTEPHESLQYYVRRGSAYDIVTCNVAGHPQAHVDYEVVETPAWPEKLGQPRRRTTEQRYDSPAVMREQAGVCYVGYNLGCVSERKPSWARFVKVDIADDRLSDVHAHVYYSTEGWTWVPGHTFCTSTEKPIPIEPSVRWVGVYLYSGPCADGTPAQATTGTVTFGYSSHR